MSIVTKQERPLIERNIILVGFMGVGKTSIGKKLAQKMYRDFVDVDQEIEDQEKMSISDIFKTKGEHYFRKLEEEIVLSTCEQKLKIISLGGGAFTQESIKNRCLADGLVIYLDIGFQSWKDRVHLLVDSRPILQGKTINELEHLYFERKDAYARHHSRFLTDSFSVDDAADYLKESLQLAYEMET